MQEYNLFLMIMSLKGNIQQVEIEEKLMYHDIHKLEMLFLLYSQNRQE